MLKTGALLLQGGMEFAFREHTFPERLAPGMVHLRVLSVALCRSDLDYAKGDTAGRKIPFPFVLGHEPAARVIEVGDDVTSVKKGDIVFVNPMDHNQQHQLCELGLPNLVQDVRFLATPPVNGALREEMIYPAHLLTLVPNGEKKLDIIPLIEPMACGVHAVDLGGIPNILARKKECTVAVFGPGPIGLLAAVAALRAGATKLILIGRQDPKLGLAHEVLSHCFSTDRVETVNAVKVGGQDELVKKVMELTDGAGVDLVIEATGAEEVMLQSLLISAPRASVVIIGRQNHMVPLDMQILRRREIAVLSSYRFTPDDIRTAANIIVGPNPTPIGPMVTHRFPLARGGEAFALAAQGSPTTIKILIENFD